MKQTGRYLGGGALPSVLAGYFPHGEKVVHPDGRWYRYVWRLSKAGTGYYLTYHVYEPYRAEGASGEGVHGESS